MNNRLILILDPFCTSGTDGRVVYEVENPVDKLMELYDKIPTGMALYHDEVEPSHNVTPSDKAGIERLLQLQGDIYAVQYPGEPLTIALISAAIFAVALFTLKPQVPPTVAASGRNSSAGSSNNDLSQRSNKGRPNGRIPDIYGEVISVPDLLGKTYTIFKDHLEYEYSYFCVGRGEYQITELKDDTTLISQIEGASVEVYGPNTSPNAGTPQLTVGEPIGERVLSVARTEAVNGQTLVPPNDDLFTTSVQFYYPDRILLPSSSGVDFTELFTAGDNITLTASCFIYGGYTSYTVFLENIDAPTATAGGVLYGFQLKDSDTGLATSAAGSFLRIIMSPQTVGSEIINLTGIYHVVSDDLAGTLQLRDVSLFNATWALLPGGATALSLSAEYALTFGQDVNMSGLYEIDTVSEHEILLVAPGLVNGNWAYMYSGGQTMPNYPSPGQVTSATFSLTGGTDAWIGPFDIPLNGSTNFIANFVSPNGLYKDDGTTQYTQDVQIELEVTPISAAGAILGPPRVYRRTVEGSAVVQSQRALTVRATVDLPPSVALRFRARRVTPKDVVFVGQVVGDIQWKDMFVTAPVRVSNFGNVTTIQAVTQATRGALSVKSRKLNCRAARMIPALDSLFGYTGPPVVTKDFADILRFICMDEKNGNYPEEQINLQNFRETSDAIATYFHREAPRNFSYTFDDPNMSAEEMITSIAAACFCIPYRRGNVINIRFEKLEDSSSLLFNHRNKLPGSEKRTTTFGIDGGYDGIEYEYVDPIDGSTQTIYLPSDRSAVKAKSFESIGVRSKTQATLLANRIWNKLRYQRTAVEFIATQEASLLARNERVLVVNNTKSRAQDGQIQEKVGLILTTSQPVVFESGVDYVAFIQCTDGTVQSIPCVAGVDEYHIVLDSEPTAAMSLDPANYAVATYAVVPETDTAALAFLVTEKAYDGPFTSKVSLINYDPRYYANDQDFAARIAHYLPATADGVQYDAATTDQKNNGGFYADGTANPPTIPATAAQPYVYGSTTYEE